MSRCADWRVVRGSDPRTSCLNGLDKPAHTRSARFSRRLYVAAAAHFDSSTNSGGSASMPPPQRGATDDLDTSRADSVRRATRGARMVAAMSLPGAGDPASRVILLQPALRQRLTEDPQISGQQTYETSHPKTFE